MLGGGAEGVLTCPGGGFLTTLSAEGDKVVFDFMIGRHSCSKMIEVECGAPAFQVQTTSGTVYSEFLVHWLEYDPKRITPATSAFVAGSAIAARGAMGIKAGMAGMD